MARHLDNLFEKICLHKRSTSTSEKNRNRNHIWTWQSWYIATNNRGIATTRCLFISWNYSGRIFNPYFHILQIFSILVVYILVITFHMHWTQFQKNGLNIMISQLRLKCHQTKMQNLFIYFSIEGTKYCYFSECFMQHKLCSITYA